MRARIYSEPDHQGAMAAEAPKVDFCIRCGEYLRPGLSFCPKCGAPLTAGAPYRDEIRPAAATKRPTWAGILLILSGVVGFVMTVYLLLDSKAIIEQAEQLYGGDLPGAEGVMLALAGFASFAGAMSLIGGICALRRRNYLLAILGAVFGLMTIGFFMEGSIMALIALFLLLTSKREFGR